MDERKGGMEKGGIRFQEGMTTSQRSEQKFLSGRSRPVQRAKNGSFMAFQGFPGLSVSLSEMCFQQVFELLEACLLSTLRGMVLC
jgi:hypothetical protein